MPVFEIMPTAFTLLQERIAQTSDSNAFKELYYILFNDLTRFANIFIQQKELSEEVVQDVFTKLWQQRSNINSINNLKVYLYSATKNTALNYRKKYPLQSLSALSIEALNVSYDIKNPEELFITREMFKQVNEAIETMPPKCKLIFILVKEDGLKYKEVAQILNISPKTVENQMGIALKKLSLSLRLKINS